jgi:hypothetical protein
MGRGSSKTQALLDQLLGIELSRGAIATIRQRHGAVLEQPMREALDCARQQPLAYLDKTGAPTGNANDQAAIPRGNGVGSGFRRSLPRSGW